MEISPDHQLLNRNQAQFGGPCCTFIEEARGITVHTILYRILPSSLLLLVLICQIAAAASIPAPPQVSAGGHLLIDYDSDHILAENNADQTLEPASLTKIMTAYAVLHELREGNIKLADEVLVSEKAWRTPGSRMFIEVNKRVSVESLLKGMIVQSGNDASVALAEHIAGSEETFANLMNDHARRLGMVNSHFANSTGLPDQNHYTTARDIAKVTKATILEFPEYYAWYAIKEFTFNDIQQHNRNLLLWRDNSVDGVKTGHTEAAGYCLVASAKRDNMRLISVVMGTDSEESRARETQALLNYGFRFYETHRLYGANEPLSQVRVWKGEKEKASLGLTNGLSVTIPRNQYENLKASMSVDTLPMAPVRKGQILGSVKVFLDGALISSEPLVSLEPIGEGSILQNVKDTVLLWFE
ncbi:MAG: D-alanyl-D-alanine carboxypeptidase [Gammaproteobacteria bacterium]|nr:D-alanyl-D-alanine carboxypeptidase [Gammaproteobacteria bacterium]